MPVLASCPAAQPALLECSCPCHSDAHVGPGRVRWLGCPAGCLCFHPAVLAEASTPWWRTVYCLAAGLLLDPTSAAGWLLARAPKLWACLAFLQHRHTLGQVAWLLAALLAAHCMAAGQGSPAAAGLAFL